MQFCLILPEVWSFNSEIDRQMLFVIFSSIPHLPTRILPPLSGKAANCVQQPSPKAKQLPGFPTQSPPVQLQKCNPFELWQSPHQELIWGSRGLKVMPWGAHFRSHTLLSELGWVKSLVGFLWGRVFWQFFRVLVESGPIHTHEWKQTSQTSDRNAGSQKDSDTSNNSRNYISVYNTWQFNKNSSFLKGDPPCNLYFKDALLQFY